MTTRRRTCARPGGRGDPARRAPRRTGLGPHRARPGCRHLEGADREHLPQRQDPGGGPARGALLPGAQARHHAPPGARGPHVVQGPGARGGDRLARHRRGADHRRAHRPVGRHGRPPLRPRQDPHLPRAGARRGRLAGQRGHGHLPRLVRGHRLPGGAGHPLPLHRDRVVGGDLLPRRRGPLGGAHRHVGQAPPRAALEVRQGREPARRLPRGGGLHRRGDGGQGHRGRRAAHRG